MGSEMCIRDRPDGTHELNKRTGGIDARTIGIGGPYNLSKADPDGYTLLFLFDIDFSITKFLNVSTPYEHPTMGNIYSNLVVAEPFIDQPADIVRFQSSAGEIRKVPRIASRELRMMRRTGARMMNRFEN